MAKFLSVESNDGRHSTIGWKKAYWSNVSSRIQYGSEEKVNDKSKGNLSKFDAKNAPLTEYQARALHAAGYRRTKKNGKLGGKATVAWMRGKPTADKKYRTGWNVSAYKAAVILNSMRKRGLKLARKNVGAGDDDRIKIRGRSFLGATNSEVKKYVIEIMNQMKQEVTRVAR
jgi:hypothetical protein